MFLTPRSSPHDEVYKTSVFWDALTFGKGEFNMTADRDSVSRSIVYDGSLMLHAAKKEPHTYEVKVELDNRSTDDTVHLNLAVELLTTIDAWE